MARNSFIIVAGSKPRLDEYTSGQEYYLRTMISVLEEIGYSVKVLSSRELSNARLSEGGYIHFYYAPLKTIAQSRLKNMRARTCFHVYHLEDVTWSTTTRLKWKVAVLFAQHMIDKYLVTSKGLLERLERLAINKDKIVKIEPFYTCRCQSFTHIESLVEKRIQNTSTERPLRLLYLGRYNPKRVPLTALMKAFNAYCEQYGKEVKLEIVTRSKGAYDKKKWIRRNLTVEVMNEYLSEEEKCNLYREADFFLYVPEGNVAMNPPITILEAVYHGAIPIVAPSVLKDLDVPKELVAENVCEAPSVIQRLCENGEIQEKVKSSLAGFGYFYSKSRYVSSIRTLVARSE